MTVENENDEGNSGENEDQNDDQGNSGDSADKKFSQSDLNRVGSREKKDGREAALKEVADKLGIDDLDEAARLLKEARDRQDQDKSDAQKASEAAEKAKTEADTAKADANAERHALRIERHLLRAGVPEGEGESEGKALARVSRMLDVKVGADADEIKEAVEDLKKDFPALFKTSNESGDEDADGKNKVGNKDSDTGGKPKREIKGGSASAARDRLLKAHPHLAKKSD